jgi:hypothetical protein
MFSGGYLVDYPRGIYMTMSKRVSKAGATPVWTNREQETPVRESPVRESQVTMLGLSLINVR